MQHSPKQSPTWDEFLRPLLELAEQGPIMRRTAVPVIADLYNFSERLRNFKLNSGQSQIENRAGWAMSSLVKAKFIEKHATEKYTYQITDAGRTYLSEHTGIITANDLKCVEGYQEAWKAASKRNQQNKKKEGSVESVSSNTPKELIENAVAELSESLQSSILDNLLVTDPYRFEQIVIDVLVAMGYGGSREEAARVTQRSNDGGIDGIINEDRLGLEVIYVQAKRYKGNVGRVDVQNFVGALAGKQAHKGIFITTSGFNSNAIEYAVAVPQKVILIDGGRLTDLMIEHGVGVSTEQIIAIKRIDTDYFEEK